ncbi:hypothetical protein PSP31121_04769 [Pandoraea sputorum]|uniref:Uncharacterized protein n=1 Tax=Pandoraea sputorum TaxID=93222 RepID=A0A5E5BE17_9BURK|nr:hypothetical protein PSP31121_04769 [Pandoraea sputorum]
MGLLRPTELAGGRGHCTPAPILSAGRFGMPRRERHGLVACLQIRVRRGELPGHIPGEAMRREWPGSRRRRQGQGQGVI